MSCARPHFKLSYETKRTFLHHLRRLLRECTYLPDPAARTYHHNYVLDRFRDYRPRSGKNDFWPSQKWIRDERHQVQCLHKCRQRISLLYRANGGEKAALTNVLLEAYGRIGKRKHELLKPYTQPDIPNNPDELQKPEQAIDSPILQLPEALKLLGRTQPKQHNATTHQHITKFAKYTKPVLPEKNIWGRPMPRKRIRNAKRRTYNELLKRLLPPLPQDEWDRLRGLAAGETSFPKLPLRRTRLPGLPELPVVEDGHNITRRFMQRLWGSLFVICPTMNFDAVKSKWQIAWGQTEDIKPGHLDIDKKLLYLFEPLGEMDSLGENKQGSQSER